MRTADGAYRDVHRLAGPPSTRSSIASFGPGLIALCIEDELGWNPQAADQALLTLRLLNGRGAFAIDRTPNGYFRHFFDARTGRGSSEFSTIDTALALAGAVFCANQFSNQAVRAEAAALWRSIDWSVALADAKTARIHLVIGASGRPARGAAHPFSEYLLCAWYVHAQRGGTASNFFAFYPPLAACPQSRDFHLPTGHPAHISPSFTILFPYYLAAPCRNDAAYREQMERWAATERRHWATLDGVAWGSSAGDGPQGYEVDSLGRNPQDIASPPIMAGFLPVDPGAAGALSRLLSEGRGRVAVGEDAVLWRFSLKQPAWRSQVINGVDFSTFLYGLAAADPRLGDAFFDRGVRLDRVQ